MAHTTDDLQTIRTAIGGETRERLAEALVEPIPADMTALLTQLDQAAQGNSDAGSACYGPRDDQPMA